MSYKDKDDLRLLLSHITTGSDARGHWTFDIEELLEALNAEKAECPSIAMSHLIKCGKCREKYGIEKAEKYLCPKCGVTNPDAWCGGCGISLEKAERCPEVKFINPNSGYPKDQALARKYLELGKSYAIDKVDEGDWHTDIFLKEFPNIGFNSVLFDYGKLSTSGVKERDDMKPNYGEREV